MGGLNLYAYCANNPVMLTDPVGTSWKSFWKKVGNGFKKVGNWINDNIIQPTVNFFEENWDLVLAGILFVGAITATILSLGTFTLVAVAAGAIIGAAYGALNSYLTGGEVWQGMLTGFVVGAFGGISGLAGGFAAAGMSIVMDHVNGKKAGWDTLGRALGIGVFAGLFAVGSNAMSSTVSFKEGILVEWISNLTFASLFTLGNIAFDLTVRKLKKNYGK